VVCWVSGIGVGKSINFASKENSVWIPLLHTHTYTHTHNLEGIKFITTFFLPLLDKRKQQNVFCCICFISLVHVYINFWIVRSGGVLMRWYLDDSCS
jgi:hypothetical protein